ncbi:MAG: hypothetical protein SFU86_25135 [Pirellulaceae bacterium]|nr:hypothetical protein [Pirellulaceae bacterium]
MTGNALAVVRHAVRGIHGDDEWQRLSGYYLADELARNYQAVDALMDDNPWQDVRQQSPQAFWIWTQAVAQQLRPAAFDKHPRSLKLPPPPRRSGKQRHHFSTYRLPRNANKIP